MLFTLIEDGVDSGTGPIHLVIASPRNEGPIVQFFRRITLRKNIARTPGLLIQAAYFLLKPRYNGRAMGRSFRDSLSPCPYTGRLRGRNPTLSIFFLPEGAIISNWPKPNMGSIPVRGRIVRLAPE